MHMVLVVTASMGKTDDMQARPVCAMLTLCQHHPDNLSLLDGPYMLHVLS